MKVVDLTQEDVTHVSIDCDIVPEKCWGDRLGHMVGIGGLGWANGIENDRRAPTTKQWECYQVVS